MSFWQQHEANEEIHLAAVRERQRAEREAEVLDRIPHAEVRLCCHFRHVRPEDVCPGECRVLAATLG